MEFYQVNKEKIFEEQNEWDHGSIGMNDPQKNWIQVRIDTLDYAFSWMLWKCEVEVR